MRCLIVLFVSAAVIKSHPIIKDDVGKEIFPSKQSKEKEISIDDIFGVTPSTTTKSQHEDIFDLISTTQQSTTLTTKPGITEDPEIFLLKPTTQNTSNKDVNISLEDIFGCANGADCSDIKLEEIFRPPTKNRRKRQHFHGKNNVNLENRFGKEVESERSHDYSKEIMSNPEYVWTTSNLDDDEEDHKGNRLENKDSSHLKPGLKQALNNQYFWSTKHRNNLKDTMTKMVDQSAWHGEPYVFSWANPALKERSNFEEEVTPETEEEKVTDADENNEATEKADQEEPITKGEVESTMVQETEDAVPCSKTEEILSSTQNQTQEVGVSP